MSDNKLVKTLIDAAGITGLAAGIEFLAKKVIKEPMTSDPSSNLMLLWQQKIILKNKKYCRVR